MKQSVTGCYINKSGGAGVRNMMMMEDSAKLTKGISAVNYMRVAALMIYAALAQLAEYSILMGIRVRASDAAQ